MERIYGGWRVRDIDPGVLGNELLAETHPYCTAIDVEQCLYAAGFRGVVAFPTQCPYDRDASLHKLRFNTCAEAKSALASDDFFIKQSTYSWHLTLKPKPCVCALLAEMTPPVPQHHKQQPSLQQTHRPPQQASQQSHTQTLHQNLPFQHGQRTQSPQVPLQPDAPRFRFQQGASQSQSQSQFQQPDWQQNGPQFQPQAWTQPGRTAVVSIEEIQDCTEDDDAKEAATTAAPIVTLPDD
ncbi:hypothetical protein Pelo_7066 [Pelomyxa schiedti]|nr:hypothetical protein Pelo_7066 [Pelomyxa schiedti]